MLGPDSGGVTPLGCCPHCGHPWDEHDVGPTTRVHRLDDGMIWVDGKDGREGCTHRLWSANGLPKQCRCGEEKPRVWNAE